MKPLNNKSKWSKPRDSDQAHLILFFLKTILLQKLIKLMNNSFYWGLDSRQMREMSWLNQSRVMSQYWLMTDGVGWWCKDAWFLSEAGDVMTDTSSSLITATMSRHLVSSSSPGTCTTIHTLISLSLIQTMRFSNEMK